jgi:hypothetical protein
MSFKKNKYKVVKQVVSKELVLFLYNYLTVKKQVYDTCLKSKYVSPFERILGTYDDYHVPDTYGCYGDVAMETLMLKIKPTMEKETSLKLNPSYTFLRIYKKGDILSRHKDRFSCEISTTLNLGGDPWPIYLEPSGEEGKKGIKVDLEPGDMLVYRGMELEHWREPFKGNECVQVFLHYNNSATKGSKENIYDKRPHIGLPDWFTKKN